MARLFADENFTRRTAEELRRSGHDVLTIQELGKAGRRVSDAEVLDLAVHDGRAVLTFNRRDFRRLHRSHLNHCGIISCTYDPDYSALASRIDDAINKQGVLNGRLILVYRPHQ